MHKALLFLSVIAMLQCTLVSQKTEMIDPGLLVGKWRWIESHGGIGGWHLSPESEGYTRTVVFMKTNRYEEFTNDSLTTTNIYTYDQKRGLLSIGTAAYNIFFLTLRGDTLRLHQRMADGFDHTYVRIIQ